MLVHVPWFTQESSHRTWCINVTVTDKLFVLMTLWVLKLCGKVQYLRLWTAACSVQSWESDRVQCCHDIRETPLSCITSTTSTHLSASQCSISHKSHSIVPTRSLCVIYFIRVCVCIYGVQNWVCAKRTTVRHSRASSTVLVLAMTSTPCCLSYFTVTTATMLYLRTVLYTLNRNVSYQLVLLWVCHNPTHTDR